MAMKLGIIAEPTVEDVRKTAEKGLSCVEYCYNVGRDVSLLEKSIPELLDAYREYGVSLGALGRWGAFKIDDEGKLIESEWENTCRLIDVAAALGAPVFNTGVNYVDKLPYLVNIECAKAFLEKTVAYAATKGVKVATVNCDWDNFVRTPKEWDLIHGAIPQLGIKYDPSHCVNCGSGKYLEEIEHWGDRIYHFHLKGTINIAGRHIDDPPAGLDCIKWQPVMGLLYAKGYDGMLSIEPHSGVWKGSLGEWGVRYTIRYFKEMLYQEAEGSQA